MTFWLSFLALVGAGLGLARLRDRRLHFLRSGDDGFNNDLERRRLETNPISTYENVGSAGSAAASAAGGGASCASGGSSGSC